MLDWKSMMIGVLVTCCVALMLGAGSDNGKDAGRYQFFMTPQWDTVSQKVELKMFVGDTTTGKVGEVDTDQVRKGVPE